MSGVRDRLQEVFRDVFEDNGIVLRDDLAAKDIPEWDSLQHINLIIAVEKAFEVRFATAEIARLKQPGQDVGSFIRLIEEKVRAKSP